MTGIHRLFTAGYQVFFLAAGLIAVFALASAIGLPAPLVMALDLAFVPVIGTKVLSLLLKRPQPGQMIFPVILSVFFAAALALPLLLMAGIDGPVFAGAAPLAGLAGLAQLSLWREVWTLTRRILWALHQGYAMNATGLIALGLAALATSSEVAALHLPETGAVGGMTLAVMSRFTGAQWPALHYPVMLASGALWITAFILYLAEFWPVFTGPRSATRLEPS